MEIKETEARPMRQVECSEFVERRLEEVQQRLIGFKRADEKPFESVAKISDLNQQTYELFARH